MDSVFAVTLAWAQLQNPLGLYTISRTVWVLRRSEVAGAWQIAVAAVKGRGGN